MRPSISLFLVLALAVLPGTVAAQQELDEPETPDFLDLSITPQYQSLGRDGGHNGNYELDFVGLATLRSGSGAVGSTRLAWWALRNETFSGLSTGALAQRAGLLWNFNDGDAPEAENAIGVFALQQMFNNDRTMLQLGKLYPGNDFAESDYWGDDRDTFLSEMMASDVAGRWFTTIGLGAHLAWFGDGWFAQAAIVDAQATNPYFDFSSLREGKFLWAAELGLNPDWGGKGTQLSLTPYTIDRTRWLSREKGIVAAFTHEWSDFAAFGRYTWRDGGEGLTAADVGDELPVRHGGFVGLAWNRPFGRSQDRIAFAVMRGEPTRQARLAGFDSQVGAELYWAIRPNPWVIISPDLQLVRNRDGRTETIVGIRVKLGLRRPSR